MRSPPCQTCMRCRSVYCFWASVESTSTYLNELQQLLCVLGTPLGIAAAAAVLPQGSPNMLLLWCRAPKGTNTDTTTPVQHLGPHCCVASGRSSCQKRGCQVLLVPRISNGLVLQPCVDLQHLCSFRPVNKDMRSRAAPEKRTRLSQVRCAV